MVWMAGDNDLESFGDQDLAGDEAGRLDRRRDVAGAVRPHARRPHAPVLRHGGRWRPTTMSSQELGETNTGDPPVAIDFFRWGIDGTRRSLLDGDLESRQRHRRHDIYARRGARGGSAGGGRGAPVRERPSAPRSSDRALSGGIAARCLAPPSTQATHDRAIAFDDTVADFLDNARTEEGARRGDAPDRARIDLLGFDACLMNMIEIAYQMQRHGSVIVGLGGARTRRRLALQSGAQGARRQPGHVRRRSRRDYGRLPT